MLAIVNQVLAINTHTTYMRVVKYLSHLSHSQNQNQPSILGRNHSGQSQRLTTDYSIQERPGTGLPEVASSSQIQPHVKAIHKEQKQTLQARALASRTECTPTRSIGKNGRDKKGVGQMKCE